MIPTTCPYCGVGCGVKADISGVAGDTEHPANFGKLCVKGATLAQTLDDSNRLLHPAINGHSSSWDAALDLVSIRFSETIVKHGPDSVAIYGSGQFLTEDYYVANKLMKGFIGSANIDTNSRLCMASTVAGHVRAFGEDVVPGCYEDIDEADLLVFVGANSAWCHPVLFERAQAARARRGTKILVIDPRHTATAALADLHLAVRPDGDAALFAHLLCEIADRNLADTAFIAAHTTGFAETLTAARASAGAHGVAARPLAEFLDLFCKTDRTVTLFSQGVNQSVAGTDKVNAIINVHLATGRIARLGCGPFSLTGQPNAMGGREVGGLANQLAAHLNFDSAEDRALLTAFWRAPALPRKPGLKAVEMFDAVLSGKVKAIWIAATNPAESLPRAKRVRAALEACPFVVVSDCWPTETARLANVVLPAAGWGEKDGTVTNSERRISRQRPFRAPVGQAKPDWWMFTEIARRMGFAEQFPYRTPADIFREHAALSGYGNVGARRFNISQHANISDKAFESLAPFQWGSKRVFANRVFSNPDARAHFIPVTPPETVGRDASYPFVLNTGRLRDQWHSMTRTGFVPALMASDGEAVFAIAPADAEQLGIADGGLVRVTTRHGCAVLPAKHADSQRRGEIFAAMHWTASHSAAGSVNALIGPARDPISGQPAAKHERAALTPLQTVWVGIMQTRGQPNMHGQFHAARVPLPGAMQRVTLAGYKPLAQGAALSDWAARLAGVEGEPVECLDSHRTLYRLGIFSEPEGALQAALFIAARKSALPGPATLAALFAARFDNRTAILRGASSPEAPVGRTVCVCHGVTETKIRETIAAGALATVAAVGAACRAGTNCGSCKGEIAKLLTEMIPEMV